MMINRIQQTFGPYDLRRGTVRRYAGIRCGAAARPSRRLVGCVHQGPVELPVVGIELRQGHLGAPRLHLVVQMQKLTAMFPVTLRDAQWITKRSIHGATAAGAGRAPD